MDQQPESKQQSKTGTRKVRELSKFTPEHVGAPAAVKEPEPVSTEAQGKPVVNADLQENDVKATITVKLVDRYGTVFQDEDQATLGGILDPANRGHLARSVEENFARMGSVVVATFNKLVDERTKAKEEVKPKDPVRETTGNIVMPTTPPLVSLEALQAALPPPPKMPGAGASLNSSPGTN